MIVFTKPFQNPQESPIRALFKHLKRPGMISFAGGQPGQDIFEALRLKETIAEALRHAPGRLDYGETQGLPGLRDELAVVMNAQGIHCDGDDIIVTTGSQQALDILLRVFISPGDTVLVEQPAYPTTAHALRLAMADIHAVETDEQGIRPDRLRQILSSLSATGRAPKFLYTVPNFSNPTGVTLSYERRLAVLSLAQRFGLLIIEDDPYGLLRFTGTAIESMRALSEQTGDASQRVVYVSSLSKTLAPGIRIGWMVAPEEIKRRCVIAKQTTDICTPLVCQEIAESCLKSGMLRRSIPEVISLYKGKQERMLACLNDAFGREIDVVQSDGGIFLWVRWTSDLDTEKLLAHAVEEGVLYVPGSAFFIGDPDHRCLRLSFSSSTLQEIEEGIARLARARARLMKDSVAIDRRGSREAAAERPASNTLVV